ncbi:HNH endonuclease [Shewanella frigidimarina]|uniref:HNH nuclease domain-containing protein n=1 Tax=Shewanella frigidimarina TaxID=56812 RepID=A0A106BXJ6_SHEFR|nr:HNH endonuclease signature motif containing protein [Shewanella frigidimarina]KVX00447.1 hypothetical protein AWJ07_20660 [Shewanella frigidimarina]
MYEINDGYNIQLKELKESNPKLASLFESVGQFLDNDFNWEKQSAVSQAKKPKYRLTLNDNVSLRPNVTIIPYKNHVQIKVGYLQDDEKRLENLLPKYFVKIIFKDRYGNDTPALAFNVKDIEQLKLIRGMNIEGYFSPKLTSNYNKKVEESERNDEESERSDKTFNDEMQLVAIKTRKGQPYLRKILLDKYKSTCIVTGCKIESLLEAAHILPHSENGSYNFDNGLLLRSDIHNLFDSNLLSINSDGVLYISNGCHGSEYEKYNNIKVLEVDSDVLRINLGNRFKKFIINN